MKKQKWHFIELNRGLVEKESNIEKQRDCKHDKWIAKCSYCGKVLASETQNVTEIDILRIVNQIKQHIC